MADWSARQYTAFEDERTRPVRDLVAALPADAGGPLIDIGCGPANSTEVLVARFPGLPATGLDSSKSMLDAARARLPHVRFELGDIASWKPDQPYGVVLANAVLQWLDRHEELLPRLISYLRPGGSLAVQMPDNMDEPAYRAMRGVAADPAWSERLASAGGFRGGMTNAEGYYRILKPHCARVDVWRTTYHHVMLEGAAGVVEWFKGSGLRPYLNALDAGQQTEFLARYRDEVAGMYPALPDGSVLLPFPRLFLVATR